MSTTITVYAPEPPCERPVTIEFAWEGCPAFVYGLTLDQAERLADDLHRTCRMLSGTTQPVLGSGPHRQLASATAIELLKQE